MNLSEPWEGSRMNRRHVLLGATGCLLLCSFAAAAEDAYPNRPVRVVIGYAAGGLTDVMSRLIADRMSRELGQPLAVENKSGGATSIASTIVAQAPADGYTLLMGTTSLAINPALQPNLTPKNPRKELEPIGKAYETPFALLVNNTVPAHTLAEFIAHAKANPDKINVASSGTGAVNHLLLEMFNRQAGVRMVHVPYRGASPALIDLQGGRVEATFATPLDAVPVADQKKGTILAVTSKERIPLLPDAPPVADTLAGFNGVFWQGLFAPAGTPKPIVARLAGALRVTTEDPELRAKVAERGVVMVTGGPEELRQQLAAETDAWGRLIRDADIKPD
jgi:tripartite-type tricarboxylate transporter receptor subunit TctC